jgi:hypothetical protein
LHDFVIFADRTPASDARAGRPFRPRFYELARDLIALERAAFVTSDRV